MRARLLIAGATAVAAGFAAYAVLKRPPAPASRPLTTVTGLRPRTVPCPATRQTIDIPAVSLTDQRSVLKHALETDGMTVRLGPGVDLDFSKFDSLPLKFGRCVTLTSVSSLDDQVLQGVSARIREPGSVVPEGRSPSVPGPVLRYGEPRPAKTFLEIRCFADGSANDGARISGFRLFGPSLGQQSTFDVGIRIIRCIDVDVSNMEIAGWGGEGVAVEDDAGPDTGADTNGPGGRIVNPFQVSIHDSWIHNNQHPQQDDQAGGYGVGVNHGAWAHVFRNAFDLNRHSVEAAGDAGGYVAEQNLVLKGGGYHGKWYSTYTHVFDVHGTGCWWSDNLCGDAGIQFTYSGNAFQYHKDHAIKIRGKPARNILITNNVFPHSDLEGDIGDDAITLHTRENVTIGAGNVIDFDSFGRYGVCDFDGDGVDDLFLATRKSWWFSGFGEFQWTFLTARQELLGDLALGYFDNDNRCDVLVQSGSAWMILSGGSGNPKIFGLFGVPLKDVVFGQFDPTVQDRRPGATRRTTHAFHRQSNGQWEVTALTARNWQPVASSSFPMSKLRFGDFTGDGVTDVLAVENGRWAISVSARSQWRRLNASLNDPVGNLFIANMDADDNIDDILKLELETIKGGRFNNQKRTTRAKWYRSKNGTEPWQLWKSYEFKWEATSEVVPPGSAFVGRFGAAPGGGTLLVGPDRYGYFHSKAESAVGASPDWRSVFAY